jgi:uncharacterized protein
MHDLILAKDYAGIRQALEKNPQLANEGIPCLDGKNPAKAHPLHRICDGVISGDYTDEDALEMAKIFLEFGADINGVNMVHKRDTPLISAASLHAEITAIYYIGRGADIFHAGTHGGTALHWAAWVGRDKLVKELIGKGAEVNKLCIDFHGTPLLWAVHGYTKGGQINRHNQVECARLLIAAGADKSIVNVDGHAAFEFLSAGDKEMFNTLNT